MARTPSTTALLEQAQQWLGTPYSWGGGNTSGPTKGIQQGANTVGFDCSSFVQYLYAQQGVTIGRTTYDQVNNGTAVDRSDLRPGDILFFHASARGPEHEGLYVGNGKFIEAPHTGATIRISELASRDDYVSARRIIPSDAPSLRTVVAKGTKPAAAAQAAAAEQPAAEEPTTTPTVVPPPSSPMALPGGGLPDPTPLAPGSVSYTLDDRREAASTWQMLSQKYPASRSVQQQAYLASLGVDDAGP